jgi:hypothetical protein
MPRVSSMPPTAEVARYIARRGESMAKAALLSAVPPLMVETPANPGGLPNGVFDDLQAEPNLVTLPGACKSGEELGRPHATPCVVH